MIHQCIVASFLNLKNKALISLTSERWMSLLKFEMVDKRPCKLAYVLQITCLTVALYFSGNCEKSNQKLLKENES
jgi:hypothetical protein